MASVGTILETLSCSTRWRDSDWNSAAIGDGNCGMIWCCCFVHTCWVLPGARLETAAGPLPAAQLAPTHRHVEEQERRPAPTLHSVKPCGPLPAIATTAPTSLELWCIFELAVVEERRGVARDRRVHTVLRVKQVDGLAGCGEPVSCSPSGVSSTTGWNSFIAMGTGCGWNTHRSKSEREYIWCPAALPKVVAASCCGSPTSTTARILSPACAPRKREDFRNCAALAALRCAALRCGDRGRRAQVRTTRD